MPKLFILGSGFSKAVSNHMPVIGGLGKYIDSNVFSQLKGNIEVYSRLLNTPGGPVGVEELLTYLFQGMPWKNSIEYHLDMAAYHALSQGIARYLRDCERDAFKHGIPSWPYDFVKYLHRESNRSDQIPIVVSFNYDTVLERLSRRLRAPDEDKPNKFPVDSFLLSKDEVKFSELVKRLKSAQESMGSYLRGRFRQETQDFLNQPCGSDSIPEELRQVLVDELNNILQGESIYDDQRFKGFGLDRIVRSLIQKKLKGDDLVYLNRKLLEYAYQGILEKAQTLHTSDLYRMPLDNLVHRTTGTWGGSINRTYRLLKLHGSINWYFSGDENHPGETVYYTGIDSESPDEDSEFVSKFIEINKMDLTPLIIPPVAEKTPFYRNKLIRTLWGTFREALENADEIYCIGYSLPKTDLTMRLFLSAMTGNTGKAVHLVNTATGAEAGALKENYGQLFGKCTVSDRYLGKQNAVEQMVSDMCKTS